MEAEKEKENDQPEEGQQEGRVEGEGGSAAPPDVDPTPLDGDPTPPPEGDPIPQDGSDEPSSEPVCLQDSGSIIEMEVDDSNTGDTITSNPEIDLGSAAAAATAVIIEHDHHQSDEKSDDVEIIEENAAAMTVRSVESEIPQHPESPDAEDGREEIGGEPVIIEVPDEKDTGGPQVVTLVEDSEDEKVDDSKGISSPDEIMEVSQNEPGDDVLQYDPEMDVDGNEHLIEERDILEIEQDKEFLHEEESLSSLPDDAAETDKENNDLICDDDGEEDYLEITRRRISQDRDGNCYW